MTDTQLPQLVVSDQAIDEALTSMVRRFDEELYAMSETELAAKWFFRWDHRFSIEWNFYEFSDMLEAHKRQCRQWETHHHGSTCVVERVRDKYLMPLIKAFMVELQQRSSAGA